MPHIVITRTLQVLVIEAFVEVTEFGRNTGERYKNCQCTVTLGSKILSLRLRSDPATKTLAVHEEVYPVIDSSNAEPGSGS